MTRAYIRLDPEFADRKETYPDGAFAALITVFCAASDHSRRGIFKNERLLRVILDRRARWLPYLFKQKDLTLRPDGTVYIEGWEEWQEGNWMVAERMQRVRSRRNGHRNAYRNGQGNSTSDNDKDYDKDKDGQTVMSEDQRKANLTRLREEMQAKGLIP